MKILFIFLLLLSARCYADTAADAIGVLLDVEGGYVNNLKDTGEETNFGISKKSYPHIDIKHLTRAVEIYRRQWWRPLGCDTLPPVLAINFLCFAVNAGRQPALKILNEIGNKKDPASWDWFCTLAALRYQSLRNYKIFGKGWLRRLFIVYRKSIALFAK